MLASFVGVLDELDAVLFLCYSEDFLRSAANLLLG